MRDRRAAWLTGAIQVAAGAVVWRYGARVLPGGVTAARTIAAVLLAFGAVLVTTALVAPAVAVTLHRRWNAVARVIGVGVTIVLFSLMFVGVLPFFLFIRRGDPLRRRLGAASYWEPAPADDPSMDRALRQY